MLRKAHHNPGSKTAGRVGKSVAAASLCALSIALTISAQASASALGAGTQGAVAQTITRQLSSTASTTVEHVAGAPPAPAMPAPSQQAAAQAQQATPANTAGASPAAVPHAAGVVGGVIVGAVVPVVRAVRGRIAARGDAPRSAGGEAIRAIVQVATTGGGGSSRIAPVTGVAERVASLHAGEVTRAVTETVVHAKASSHVIQALAKSTSTLTAAIARGARRGGAIAHLTRPVSGPAPATLQRMERTPVAAQRAAAQQPLGAGASHASVAQGSSVVQSGAGLSLITGAALAQDRFGVWNAGAASPGIEASASRPSDDAVRVIRLLPGWQGAASSPAHGAHPATMRANPAPSPSPSPGGASPSAAVGPAAGLSIALALAALLMLATPHALRRLRLDGESWRLAPFVLIADRPG